LAPAVLEEMMQQVEVVLVDLFIILLCQ